jgi:glycolate oxidase iron-sulfur subunit
MQTSFTAEQLRDPAIAASNQVLRTCVHCGLCTATCPTFLLLGDELDSPRGRIYLIKDMLEAGRPATEEVVRHVDRCLSCLACMTTCPSGVNYMHLVDHARSYIEQTYRRPWHERLLRAMLGAVLPRPRLFRVSLLAARAVRPLALLVPPVGRLGRRLRAMLDLVPDRLPAPAASERPQIHPAQGERRARVALLTGCAQQVLAPRINEATIGLLTRSGVEVVVAQGAGCCGALNHHMGQHDAAMHSARANITAWSREIAADGLDGIVINASGCGTTVKDYGFMFRAEPEPWRSQAKAISALACDITEFLDRFGYAPVRPAPGLTVAYHAACSLQHGQQVTAQPKALLGRAGFAVVEPAEPHICCGSAGTYNLLQPEIAARLRERKLGNLRATGPDLIAAGNIGCMTQLDGGGVPVVHTIELLDWMAGGPTPAALEQLAFAGHAART